MRRRDMAVARLAADIASYALGVPAPKILNLRRGPAEVAFARQVAMYLCHIGFELSLARIAAAFGRDRSTVACACHGVEDRREEPQFDFGSRTWSGCCVRRPRPSSGQRRRRKAHERALDRPRAGAACRR
jgi:hypothetical protein